MLFKRLELDLLFDIAGIYQLKDAFNNQSNYIIKLCCTLSGDSVVQSSRLVVRSETYKRWSRICSVEGLSFGSKDYTKELKTVECICFLCQTS